MKKILIIFFLLITIFPLHAQKIGVSGSYFFMSGDMIGSNWENSMPSVGAMLAIPAGKHEFIIDYEYADSRKDYVGYLGGGFLPGETEKESITSYTYVNTLDIGYYHNLNQLEFGRIFGGIGFTYMHFAGKKISVKDEEKSYPLNSEKYGAFITFGIGFEEMFDLPLALYTRMKFKYLLKLEETLDADAPYQNIGTIITPDIILAFSF